MIKSVLFREDNVYKAFPDLVECGDGTWVCIYRESLGHTARPFGRIACHLSHDGGRTWSGKAIVDEVTDPETEGRLNNPRLLALDGSELLIICDLLPRLEPEEHPDSEIFIYRSTDSGRTWSGRASTGIRGHICPCIFRTRAGEIIIGGDRVGARDDPGRGLDPQRLHLDRRRTHLGPGGPRLLRPGAVAQRGDLRRARRRHPGLLPARGPEARHRLQGDFAGRRQDLVRPLSHLPDLLRRQAAGRHPEQRRGRHRPRVPAPDAAAQPRAPRRDPGDRRRPGLHRQPRPPVGSPVFLHRPRPQHTLRRRLLGMGAATVRGPVRRAVHQRRQPVRPHPRLRDRPLRLDPLPRGGPVSGAAALARLHRQGRRGRAGSCMERGDDLGAVQGAGRCRRRFAANGFRFIRGIPALAAGGTEHYAGTPRFNSYRGNCRNRPGQVSAAAC